MVTVTLTLPEAIKRASAACDAGRLDETEVLCRAVLGSTADHFGALQLLAAVHKKRGQYAEALTNLDRALSVRPDHAEALKNRGIVLTDLGRFGEAFESYERAIKIRPDYAEGHSSEALLRLLTGDFLNGWKKFEWRWKKKSFTSPKRDFAQPLWLGAEAVAGKTILLHSEQGYGDTIQFCRYVPLVAARGARVLLEAPKSLRELMTSLAGTPEVIVKSGKPPEFDFHCPLLSLPLAFGTMPETIPSGVPYLRAPPSELQNWAARLGPKRSPRVGLVWSGRLNHAGDHERSISLRTLLPLLDREVTFVSLQKDVRPDDAKVLKERKDIVDYGNELKNFSDTAALISHLDLVISVDTAVAHLAGALGKPVWVLLPHVPDWRWLLDRDDSPWYPSARLFRQDETRTWEGVIERVDIALRDLAKHSSGRKTLNIKDARKQAFAVYEAGRFAEAETLCHAILEAAPNTFGSLHLLAVVQSKLGRNSDALANFARALALRPDHDEALINRGILLQQLKRFEEALVSYDQALAAASDKADMHYNRGTLLKELKRFDEALECFDRALALRPDYLEALNSRGNIQKDLKRYEEALASYEQALHLRPDNVAALNNRGIVLKELRRLEEALESYNRAIELRPDYADGYNNRGNILQELYRLDEALASFDRAIVLRPKFAEPFANRAIALKLMRRFDDALADYSKAIALKPDYAGAYFNRALCYLLRGDFERGWEEYEWRWKTPQALSEKRVYAQPLWSGLEEIKGKTILLHAEQGMGDTIQFSRYARLATERGASVILQVQPALKRLLSGLAGPQIVLFARGEPLPPFDLHCPLMSLPRAFGTRLATIPPIDPRLRLPPELVQQWDMRLGPKTRPRVGIVWSGKETYRNDHHRTIALNALLGLLKLPIDLVSLQKKVRDEDNAVLDAHRSEIAHFGPALTDFLETAALASLMDVVVSIDTAVAHLAASLGRPTWVLLPYLPDWRWLLDREDSPWYPTARLFRQSRLGDWDDVMRRLAAEIANLVEGDAAQTARKTARAEN